MVSLPGTPSGAEISANPGWNLNYYTQKENQNGSPTKKKITIKCFPCAKRLEIALTVMIMMIVKEKTPPQPLHKDTNFQNGAPWDPVFSVLLSFRWGTIVSYLTQVSDLDLAPPRINSGLLQQLDTSILGVLVCASGHLTFVLGWLKFDRGGV